MGNQNTSSDSLHRLVHSLEKAERKAFRRFAQRYSQKGKQRYMQLFDLIDGQARYDETALIAGFPGVEDRQQLAWHKHHLMALLLRHLQQHHSGKTVTTRIRELLGAAEVLVRKDMRAEAARYLRRAHKLADRHEKFDLLLEVIELQLSARDVRRPDRKEFRQQEALLDQQQAALARRQNQVQMHRLSQKMSFLLQKGISVRGQAELDEVRQVLAHPLLTDVGQAQSYLARFYYYLVWTMYYRALRDLPRSHALRREMVAAMEADPQLMTEHMHKYFVALHNLLVIRMELEHKAEFRESLTKLRAYPLPEHPAERARCQRIRLDSYNLELAMYNTLGELERSAEVLAYVEPRLADFTAAMRQEAMLSLHYNMSFSYFAMGEYANALRHLNVILNSPDVPLLRDLLCIAKLVHLLIHFELGNWELMEHLIGSARRFLGRRRRLLGVERAVLEFFEKRYPVAADAAAREAAFRWLRAEFTALQDDPLEAKMLYYFSFHLWADAHIRKIPFAQLAREYAEANA